MDENVTQIHDLVLADRRLKVREIAETVGISKDRVGHILHEILGMRKLSARWVPRLLTPDNKRNRETTSQQCLTLFKRNPKEFLRRYVTVDETWIHWYTPETKERSKQWTEAYYADLQKTFFSDGLKKLEHRWVKCIELKGDYVEK